MSKLSNSWTQKSSGTTRVLAFTDPYRLWHAPDMPGGKVHRYMTACFLEGDEGQDLPEGYSRYALPRPLKLLDFDSHDVVTRLAELYTAQKNDWFPYITNPSSTAFLLSSIMLKKGNEDWHAAFQENWHNFQPFLGRPQTEEDMQNRVADLSDRNYCALICEIERIGCKLNGDLFHAVGGDIGRFYANLSLDRIFHQSYCHLFFQADDPTRLESAYDGYTFGGVTLLKNAIAEEWTLENQGTEILREWPIVKPSGTPFQYMESPVWPNPSAMRPNPWARP